MTGLLGKAKGRPPAWPALQSNVVSESLDGAVHRGDSDEVAVRIGVHERAAENVVMWFFRNLDSSGSPVPVDVVDRRRRTGSHEPDLAGAWGAQDRVLAPTRLQREQDAGGDLERDVAGGAQGGGSCCG